MTPFLLDYLCEPVTGAPLRLLAARTNDAGDIVAGELVAPSGATYPIVNGIPRLLGHVPVETVASFGEQWNYFDFDFKANWLAHTVANTFGSPEVFRGKLIVDAGGGAGRQTRWFLEYGARHVIMLELSHSVDGVAKRNLADFRNVDIVQCSIDAPPVRQGSIDGIVYCVNVIQHTPSVERTARALWSLVGPVNDQGLLRWLRFHVVYRMLRGLLSRAPFTLRLAYARTMALMRLVPLWGWVLEKAGFCVQGDVPRIPGERTVERIRRRVLCTTLNTFDAFGGHRYQHHKTDKELLDLVMSLQPELTKVRNLDRYFQRPQPIGVALRILR
jgi:uncharacterized protein YbaR (Trm112 family)